MDLVVGKRGVLAGEKLDDVLLGNSGEVEALHFKSQITGSHGGKGIGNAFALRLITVGGEFTAMDELFRTRA